jgi:membrane fusion protein, multidrug efflux system
LTQIGTTLKPVTINNSIKGKGQKLKTSNMRVRQILIVVTGIGIIGLSVWLSGWLGSMKEEPEMKPPVEVKKYVLTDKVAYSEIPTEIVSHGRVRTSHSLDAIAEVSGRMTQGVVPLKEGQKFSKGTLLYRIDDSETRLNLQSLKSNFLRDLAAILPDLKIDFNDNYAAWDSYFQKLTLDEPIPDLPAFKSAKEKTFLATRNIFSSYYNIRSAEVNLQKYRVYAPFDGAIAEVALQSGSYVTPGTRIARLIRSDKLEIMVDVNTDDIRWIEMGSPARVRAEEQNDEWSGKVVRIGEYVNESTQSINVFLAINGSEKPMYDGEYLEVKIPGKTVKEGMLIPRNAIFNNDQVYVLEDSLLKVNTINIVKINSETAIFNGLPEGSEIVVEPVVNAHNNMKAYRRTPTSKDIDREIASKPVIKGRP